MSRPKVDETKKKILGARFEQQFQKWLKEDSERTPESFINYKINGINVFDPPVTRQTLYNWRKGSMPSPEYRTVICKIFGVSEDLFDLDHLSHDELFNYSSVFITEVGKDNVQYATQEGLTLEFVRALSKIVEFDEKFPVYAPINNKKGNFLQGYTFSRSKPVNSAKIIDDDLQFLQVQQDGKTITMSRGDLLYLKEVQDEIADYVKYLFYKRKLEMPKEVEQFNEDLTDDDFDENGRVKPEFVLKHDRFAKAFEDIVDPNQKEGE